MMRASGKEAFFAIELKHDEHFGCLPCDEAMLSPQEAVALQHLLEQGLPQYRPRVISVSEHFEVVPPVGGSDAPASPLLDLPVAEQCQDDAAPVQIWFPPSTERSLPPTILWYDDVSHSKAPDEHLPSQSTLFEESNAPVSTPRFAPSSAFPDKTDAESIVLPTGAPMVQASQESPQQQRPGVARKGTNVRLVGLVARQELNGRVGLLGDYDANVGRWRCYLGTLTANVRPQNFVVLPEKPLLVGSDVSQPVSDSERGSDPVDELPVDMNSNPKGPPECDVLWGRDDLLQVLPPEPPEGHPAHVRVHEKPKSWRFRFMFTNASKKRAWMQVSCGDTFGSRFAAERIAKACFVRLAGGAPKEEVLEFRDSCFESLRVAIMGGPQVSSGKAVRSTALIGKKARTTGQQPSYRRYQSFIAGTTGHFQRRKISAKRPMEDVKQFLHKRDIWVRQSCLRGLQIRADRVISALDKDTLLAALPPEAPKGHLAHHRVRDRPHRRHFKFLFQRDGKRLSMQFAYGHAEGSRLAAERIAKHCFVRIVDGATTNDVLDTKNAYFKRLTAAATGSPSVSRP